MSDNQSNNKRIAKNTILLYFRMVLMMLLSLYTSRVILQVLGVEDYGIYNVVGGFVALFGFLNGAISSSTSRYITFALGKGHMQNLKKVFSICVLTHVVIALIILLFAETLGLWFVMNKLVIPTERFTSAMWVYQCSIISSIVMILSVPYNSDIIAHEKMSAFAYISILEVCAKLGIVYLLLIGNMDKLIFYALLHLAIQLAIRFIYSSYCSRHFEESKFHFVWDKSLFKEIFAFAGWNLWGNMANAFYTQGINIVLNLFFGPIVNAARGIAVQIQAAVQQFAVNFQTALNPQITKTFAVGDYSAMHTLINRSSKFTFYLLLCMAMPICIETEFILKLWLGQVPDYTVVFIRLMIVICIIDAVANPLMTSAAATGKVKLYQSVVGGILLLIVPFAYLALRFGGSPDSVFVVHIIVAIIAFIVRLLIVRPLIKLSLRKYISTAIMPCIYVGTISFMLNIGFKLLLPNTMISSLIVIAFGVISVLIVVYLIGLSSSEKLFINSKISVFIQRLHNDSNN